MKRVILTSESVAGLMAYKDNTSARVEKHLSAVYKKETMKYAFGRTLPLYLKIVLEY